MPPAPVASTRAQKSVRSSDEAPGLGVIARDRFEVGRAQAGLLGGLAAGHVLGRLAGLDEAGDDLQQPRLGAAGQGPGAKLFDQHHRIAHRIVGQHRDGGGVVEHLAHDLAAPAAGESAVAQADALDAEEAAKRGLATEDIEIAGAVEAGRFQTGGRGARAQFPAVLAT